MAPKHDKELLQQLKNGDYKAYDLIFLKYYKLLCINSYFFLKDEQEAKDLVQNFFIEMWDKKLYMSLEGDIKGYLYRSVKNRSLNCLRTAENAAKKQVAYELVYQTDLYTEDITRPELAYNSLKEALKELPDKRREALQMVYFENKKYIDAADEMGISINSLKTHLKIGLKNLRDKIKLNNH